MAVTLLFTSCFGVEMRTVFNADGTGRMTMKLRVSQMLLEMGEEESGVDIPLSKNDISSQYEGLDGVTVVEVTEENTEEDRIITAVIDFEDFNVLSSEDELPGEDATLETVDGNSVLRILIGPPNDSAEGSESGQVPPAEMDESMMAMMQSFMEGYSMDYTIVAPRKIISHTHGEVGKDGRTLTYNMPMGDFIMIEEPFYLEVVW
jgi:hypothetical protein